MDLKVYVFDDSAPQEGATEKRGYAKAVAVQVKSAPPVKVVDVLVAVLDQLDFSFETATAVFALWCTSPLLELQLKPDQKVKSILDRWQELLAKYTTATAHEAKDDIPVLMLRRNCFYPKSKEQDLTEEKYLRLLYNEAQFNIKTYRYVPAADNLGDYYDMAAVKACVDHGLFDAQRHTVERMKEVLSHYFTPQFLKPGVTGRDRRPQITTKWLRAFQQCSSLNLSTVDLYRRYLEVCWGMPVYSAVFFKGAIAPPCRKRMTLLDKEDVKVQVGINCEGIHLVLQERNEPLINFAFDHISWDYEKAEKEGEHQFASLYLQFDGEVGSGTKCGHVIEIFSRQAQLMDAMIEQCVDMADEEEEEHGASATQVGKPTIADIKSLAKKVLLQTCIGEHNFEGIPKGAQLTCLASPPAAASADHETRV